MEKRRPTREIVRVLEIAKKNRERLIVSQRYAEMSVHRNSGKWLVTARDLEVANHAFCTALAWVIGEGLTEDELRWVCTEDEPPCAT